MSRSKRKLALTFLLIAMICVTVLAALFTWLAHTL